MLASLRSTVGITNAGRRSDQINGSVRIVSDLQPLYCDHMLPKPVSSAQPMPGRVLMIAENGNFPSDPRVSTEARTLRDWGYAVTVVGPDDKNIASQRMIEGIKVYRFLYVRSFGGILGYLLEYTSAAIAIFTLTAYVCVTHG